MAGRRGRGQGRPGGGGKLWKASRDEGDGSRGRLCRVASIIRTMQGEVLRGRPVTGESGVLSYVQVGSDAS